MKLKTIVILLALFSAFAFAQPAAEVNIQDSSTVQEAVSAGIYTRIIDWYNDNLNYGTITLLRSSPFHRNWLYLLQPIRLCNQVLT